MTTIAFKDGWIAADRQAYLGRGEAAHMQKSKLYPLDNGGYLGFSSSIVGASFQFLKWLSEGRQGDNWPVIKDSDREMDFEALVVYPHCRLEYFHDSYYPVSLAPEPFAIGSGAAYALGAMEMGASVEEAIRVAIKFDPFTGGGVDLFKVS